MTTAPSPRRARDLAVGIAALLALATPIVLAGVASGDSADSTRVRADLRAVTARYNAVDQAIADGFAPTDECAALPGVGGVGYHYAMSTASSTASLTRIDRTSSCTPPTSKAGSGLPAWRGLLSTPTRT